MLTFYAVPLCIEVIFHSANSALVTSFQIGVVLNTLMMASVILTGQINPNCETEYTAFLF